METPVRFQQILGLRFVVEGAEAAVDGFCRHGGLAVMPSGPALMRLESDRKYREALLCADLTLPDSALMAWVWRAIGGERVRKFSGLRYLRALLRRKEFRDEGSTLWVMPSRKSAGRNASWLKEQGVCLAAADLYAAPVYENDFRDDDLLRRIELRRPRQVILCLAGGTQEQLGHWLKSHLSYRPAIHCVGAAIAFLSGDQVRIPIWVDEAGLGWLWRSASNPRVYLARYWAARRLIPMMHRYRERMPCVDEPLAIPSDAAATPIERSIV